MAIKWKSKYNLIIWLLLLCLGINSAIISIANGSRYFQKSYFDTTDFAGQISDFVEAFYANEITPNEEIVITKEEIEEYRYRYGDLTEQLNSINEQYEEQIKEAKESDNKKAEEFFIAERDKKIADVTQNFTDDDHVIEKIKEERKAQLNQSKEGLRGSYRFFSRNLKYYLTDTETNQVYTNVNLVNGIKIDDILPESDILFKGKIEEIDTWDTRLKGTILVPTASEFKQEVELFRQSQIIYYSVLAIGIVSLLVAASLYKKVEGSNDIFYEKWNRISLHIPADIRIGIFLFSSFLYSILVMICADAGNDLYTILFLGCFIGTILLSTIVLQGKCLIDDIRDWNEFKKKWKQGFIYRFLQLVKAVFENRSVATKVILITVVMIASGFGIAVALIGIYWDGGTSILIYGVLFILITIPTFIYMMGRVAYFNRITAAFEKVVKGESVPDINVKGTSTLAVLAKNVNDMKEEIKFSKKEQIKSERLKTELITNVSHDLRTPLTSIITYADLLKTPDISEDERNSYVEIIDRKSKRLKVLIDDLFEVSKMASGNMELQKNKVDIVQLLQQSLAEYDEKIKESSLQFRVTHETKPIYAVVDGPKVWRVFDNMINNTLKYSLDHTRVYITTAETEQEVTITFKNIAKYEIGENTEELFQRFKRGDTSRHTEGSGLGLAIAQSIIDLHDGSLQLEVDGDLFKATIKIPK